MSLFSWENFRNSYNEIDIFAKKSLESFHNNELIQEVIIIHSYNLYSMVKTKYANEDIEQSEIRKK